MRAAVLRALNAPLEIAEVEVPSPARGQVLVRLAYSGVCHTQLLEVRGKRGADRFLPHALGHEGAGIVQEIGDGVTSVRPGDHVVVSWMKGPGLDAAPQPFRSAGGIINAGPVTTFNEYTLVPENRVTAIAHAMPLDVASLVGCAVATGAGAVVNTANVQPGARVVIFGAGGVGLSAALAARMRQATMIIVVDVRPQKLAMATRCGATHVLNPEDGPVVDAIKELAGGKGVDVAIEAAGRKETMEQAFEAIRPGGGLAVLVGNLPFGERIAIDPFALICGKRIVGTWGGDTDPARDFPRYVELFLGGTLPLEMLITHRFPLEQINQALDTLESGDVGRALIEFDGARR